MIQDPAEEAFMGKVILPRTLDGKLLFREPEAEKALGRHLTQPPIGEGALESLDDPYLSKLELVRKAIQLRRSQRP